MTTYTLRHAGTLEPVSSQRHGDIGDAIAEADAERAAFHLNPPRAAELDLVVTADDTDTAGDIVVTITTGRGADTDELQIVDKLVEAPALFVLDEVYHISRRPPLDPTL